MSTATHSVDWQPRTRLVFGAATAAVVCACAIHYASKAAGDASAIVRWRGLIEHLARGENVYNEPGLGGSFPYPPLAGLALYPLLLLPPVTAALTWFSLKVAMAAASLNWSIRLATADEFRLPVRALAILLLLVSRPFLSDLDHGNINLLILFIVTAGLWSYRQGNDWLAGGAIALATALKLTPALFIPYFAYKRQWRVVGASLAGLVVFLLVVPSLFLGFERNQFLLRSWCGAMVVPYAINGQVETLQVNQSLAGVLFRLITDSPAIELGDQSKLAVNWLSLDHRTSFWILKSLFIVILLWIAWLSRTPMPNRRDWRLACEYALVFIAMLLISERSWKHHFVTMALPYAVLIAHLWRDLWCPRIRSYIWGTLAAAFLLMASTSSELGGWFGGGNGHKVAQAYGMFCLSAVGVLAALSLMLMSTTGHGEGTATLVKGARGAGTTGLALPQ